MGVSFEEVSFHYREGGINTGSGLDQITLDFTVGRFTAVLGAPGSGKSTLLQHLNGLLLPDQGRVRVMDYHLLPGEGKVPAGLRKRVGLVFQYPELQLFDETIEKDLCFGPLNFGASLEEAKAKAHRAAMAMNLDLALLGKNPFELSSGQMRKAAVAAVLAAEPDILVLDEPTASLDPVSRKELLELLSKLTRSEGKTVIMVTHRLEEVLPFADEYAVLGDGKLIFHGDGEELLQQRQILEQAGIMLPASIRLAEALVRRMGKPLSPQAYRDEDQLAEWMIQAMEMLAKEGEA